MSDDSTPENPYGQNPYDPTNPYGQNPYGQNPYNQGAHGQNPYGQPNPAQPQFEQGQYSATQSAAWAWKRFTQNVGVFLGLGVLTLVVPGALMAPSLTASAGEATGLLSINFSPFAFVGGVLSAAISFVFLLAISKAAIQTARTGERTSFREAFTGVNWSTTVVIALVYAVITEVASTAYFLPGLAATFLLMFLPVVVAISADVDLGTAFKAAVTTVTSNFGSSALLALFCILFAIAGFALCCVGLFAAVPMVQLALAHGFLRLTGQPVVA